MSNAAAAAPAASAPKGKKKLIIIIVLALLVLAGGGVGALLLLKKPAHADDDEAAAAPAERARPRAAAPVHDPKNPPTFAPLDPFTVNLADKETERYAQIALSLELDTAKTADTVKAFMPAIRNNILMVLAHKTSTEILAAEGKTRLAGEIQRAASRALGVDVDEPDDEVDEGSDGSKKKRRRRYEPVLPIVAVHFSNFIVQ